MGNCWNSIKNIKLVCYFLCHCKGISFPSEIWCLIHCSLHLVWCDIFLSKFYKQSPVNHRHSILIFSIRSITQMQICSVFIYFINKVNFEFTYNFLSIKFKLFFYLSPNFENFIFHNIHINFPFLNSQINIYFCVILVFKHIICIYNFLGLYSFFKIIEYTPVIWQIAFEILFLLF
jgi:hypothetical protein